MKPVTRSKLRIKLGKIVYTILRYFKWLFGKKTYAKKRNEKNNLKHIIFEHKTPLIRDLSGLEMRLQKNKITNLMISAKKIDGVIIRPGETFSFWKLVGMPTKSKGYKSGLTLKSGGLSEGIGGGLCQLTNLIFWMALHTPLDIIERYRHSYDVFPDSRRTQPFGSGATCVYNYRDLMIQNNTHQCFEIYIYLDDKYLHGAIKSDTKPLLSYKLYEKKHWITREYWGGYIRHNIISRKVFDVEGCEIGDTQVAENHALMMYQPYLDENEEKSDEKSA